MLKKRIGAVLLIRDGWVVQSIGFNKYLPVGKAEIAVEYLNQWGVDEIIILDISASANGKLIDHSIILKASRFCRVPMAVGGGIVSLEQMDILLHAGADKICLNHYLLEDMSLLTKGASIYGDQCMVAVVDFIKGKQGYEVYDYLSGDSSKRLLVDYVCELEKAGAGEIVLQSVENDGKYSGFDINAYREVCSVVGIPVIAVGGAGNAGHFDELLRSTEVSAACAGNIFHFTEHSVTILKSELVRSGHSVRLESHANYLENRVDESGRLLKSDDEYLEDLLYIRIEKEVI